MLIPRKPSATAETPDKPSLFKAPKVLSKLNVAEDTLSALEARHAQAALDAVLNDSDSAFAPFETEISTARKNVEKLKAAYAAAQKADEETQRAILEEQNRAKTKSVKASLAIAEKATVALATALTEAIKQYEIVVQQRTKAKNTLFEGAILPANNFYIDEVSLKNLLESEIARLAGAPKLGHDCPFPGGHTDERHKYSPETIIPMIDFIRQSDAGLMDLLTGKDAAKTESVL